MKRASLLAALLLSCGCASVKRPGPTLDGIAVTVPAGDKAGARRQAVESVLPLFLSPGVRRDKAPALEQTVFAPKKIKAFIGYQKLSRKGASLVEIKIDALSAALQGAGLVRPPGYASGPEVLLLAFGDRAVGPTPTERLAADALETALFARGIQAQDADDQLRVLTHPITAKTEAETVAQAAAGGWAGLVTGSVADVVRHDVPSSSWRGRARYSLSLYGVGRSTEPARLEADGDAFNVSSFTAVADSIEAAATTAALRVEGVMARKRVGRATIGVLVSGYRDPAFLNALVGDLRRTEGVEGAALVSWQGAEEMALIHAYAGALAADALAAKLLNLDPLLRITAVETEDQRLTIKGPEIPASEDRGGEE
ncbi:MAG: hypothetical protein ACHQ2Z_07735 [Elusimicrobiota bacterium]